MEIIKNKELNGLEVVFKKKPSETILTQLKENGFRWHRKKKVWYAKETKERFNFLISLNDKSEVKETNENKFGIKVGDIFYISWGWEQTNIDFFQIVKVTDKSVRIIEIAPTKKNVEVYSSMSQDFTIDNDKIFKGVERPFFVKDNVNGDLKRLDDRGVFYINKHLALKYTENKTLYESWYA